MKPKTAFATETHGTTRKVGLRRVLHSVSFRVFPWPNRIFQDKKSFVGFVGFVAKRILSVSSVSSMAETGCSG